MSHQEQWFEGHDGLQLYAQGWLPTGQSAAALIVVHGFTEHSGRYAELAGGLGRRGYAVYALDLRGHGRSCGERVFVRAFDEYLADLQIFCERVRARHPGVPLFLFGHSMGGSIVALFAATRQPELQGIALSAPAVRVGKRVFPILRRLASLAGRWFPRLRLVRLGVRYASRDPATIAQFEGDPLAFHGRFPLRTAAELLNAAQRAQEAADRLRLPLLVMQGSGDRVVDPQGAQQLFRLASSTDKTLRLYEGLYHDLLHEPERDRVTSDLLEWLDARR